MSFEARIGERFDVEGVPAQWWSHVEVEWNDSMWIRALGGGDTTGLSDAYPGNPPAEAVIENVSVSGVGILAPMDSRSVMGAHVTVFLESGIGFRGVIRRIVPIYEVSWAFFGLEFVTLDEQFRAWFNSIVESHLQSTAIY